MTEYVSLKFFCFFFLQILHATKYMHEKNVCHRDFKLENILMTKKSRTARLKITDFGLSKESNSSQNLRMKTFAGTMSYMAPGNKKFYESICLRNFYSVRFLTTTYSIRFAFEILY